MLRGPGDVRKVLAGLGEDFLKAILQEHGPPCFGLGLHTWRISAVEGLGKHAEVFSRVVEVQDAGGLGEVDAGQFPNTPSA